MKSLFFFGLLLPASICSRFSRFNALPNFKEFYGKGEENGEKPKKDFDGADDFEMSDDWRKDVAALEARLTRLEKQFKEKLAFETRRDRSDEEVGVWRRQPKNKYYVESSFYQQRNSNSKPTYPDFGNYKRLRFANLPQSGFGGNFRGIPAQYLPRDVRDELESSRDSLEDFNSPDYDYERRSSDSSYDNQEDAPYIARPKTHSPDLHTDLSGIPPNVDCDSIYGRGMTWNGVYDVMLGGKRVEVYCQFEDGGYNWMIIQRRIDGSTDFYRDWDDYKRGFGIPSGEFWIGLENLHQLTSSNAYLLRIELVDWEGKSAFAEYRGFNVGDEPSNYKLTVAGYSGDAGDALAYHNGRPFSTRDRPHDALRSINCAAESHGGWWYNACQRSNLNGRYLQDGTTGRDGICWYYWKSSQYSMKEVTMKIRRV